MFTPVPVPIDCVCLATDSDACDFQPRAFQRRGVGPHDVHIDMQYCGVCHTDLHVARGETGSLLPVAYPCVPGHELAGICVAVGSEVTRFKVGDRVGVGCMVDACLTCSACKRGEEQMCIRQTGTYCAKPSARAGVPPGAPNHTLGGYTTAFVVHERFGVKIPEGYPLEAAGPIMCAGVTLFDPLRRYGAGPGKKVAIVGLGGLGAIGVKIAKAMGAHVTAVTRSAAQAAFAKYSCGADNALISSDAGAMRAYA